MSTGRTGGEPGGGPIPRATGRRMAAAPSRYNRPLAEGIDGSGTRVKTLVECLRGLAEGSLSSCALVEEAFERIADPTLEGKRAFTRVYREGARAAARLADQARSRGTTLPLCGVPVCIKDLFDCAGETTLAGSRVRQGAAPAAADALAVRRLRNAGAVIVGRTNMTEFAFSGLGLNPHYGTPRSPWGRGSDPRRGRVPGGSSSGAAVAVADGMCVAALGSDTGGSTRIPAAFCGVVGFKPTARRVPTQGAYPLSTTLDSVGPIAASVACCAMIDAVLAAEEFPVPAAPQPASLKLGVVQNFVLDRLDATVQRTYARALDRLSAAGVALTDTRLPELDEIPAINARGTIANAEVWALHRALLRSRGDEYDAQVARRIREGERMSAADYIEILRARWRLIARSDATMAGFDALIWPTVAIVPPEIAPLETDDERYVRANDAVLRSTSVVNFLDGCALSIPCHESGEPPVGLMLVGPSLADRRVLAAGLAIEPVLRAPGRS